MLTSLFSAAVVTHEARYPAELPALLAEEARDTHNMSERRLLEFRAGRHCARQALCALGAGAVPVLRGADRAPVWPSGVTGSITHASGRDAGFAGAAVARITDVRALGLDAELDVPLDDDLLPLVLTPRERAALEHAAPHERAWLGKLVFSAKESFYKCQYALTREFLEFGDVEVDVDPGSARFRATLLRAAGALAPGWALDGRFAREGGWLVTGVELGA